MSLVILFQLLCAQHVSDINIYPSSGACDCVDELPHQSSCSQFVVCCSFCCGWYLVVFVLQVEALVLQPAKQTPPNISRSKNSNTQRTENKTTDAVIHQHSRRLLKMDILMSETCWAHNRWNEIASDIKLVFHSSTIETWCSWFWPSMTIHFNFNVSTRCEEFWWIRMRPCGPRVSIPQRLAIVQITPSPVELCLSVYEAESFHVLWNKTLCQSFYAQIRAVYY